MVKEKKAAKKTKSSSKATKKASENAKSPSVDKPKKIQLGAETQRLLRIRKHFDQTRHKYIRTESWRYGRLHPEWRAAKGIDNKTHRKMKNGSWSPEVGYRGPRLVRGLHPCGLEDILIMTPNDLDKLDPTKQCVRIAARLGARKRITLIEQARAKGFKILNIGMTDKEFADLEAMLSQKEPRSAREDVTQK